MATTQPLRASIARPAGLADRLVGGAQRLLLALATRQRVAREHRRLAELDDRQLRDIGLTRQDAAQASRRRFWE